VLVREEALDQEVQVYFQTAQGLLRPALLYQIVYQTAVAKHLNHFVLLLFQSNLVTLQILVRLWVHSTDGGFLLLVVLGRSEVDALSLVRVLLLQHHVLDVVYRLGRLLGPRNYRSSMLQVGFV
jgi:hypothetical protein